MNNATDTSDGLVLEPVEIVEAQEDEGGEDTAEAAGGEAVNEPQTASPDELVATGLQPLSIVEAVLFAADAPLPAARIAEIAGLPGLRVVKQLIAELNQKYERHGLSFRIDEIAGGYQMLTLPEYDSYLAKLQRVRQESKLSAAALETLAIIAYKQPVLRADVEVIRGVACGEVLNRLRELNLIKILGRAEDVGRPILYGTTKKFLEVFGLASLEDLPQIEALKPPE
jgi:segregation and condensation protein B